MDRQRERANAAIGLAVYGSVASGVAGFVGAIAAFGNGEPLAAAVFLTAGGLAFGLLANALLRG